MTCGYKKTIKVNKNPGKTKWKFSKSFFCLLKVCFIQAKKPVVSSVCIGTAGKTTLQVALKFFETKNTVKKIFCALPEVGATDPTTSPMSPVLCDLGAIYGQNRIRVNVYGLLKFFHVHIRLF
jgi:hypothetical protein